MAGAVLEDDLLRGRLHGFEAALSHDNLMLLAEYKQRPKFFIERRWAEAREEILGAKDIEKFYINPGTQPMVLPIGRNPAVVRRKIRERLKAQNQETGGR